MAGIVYLFFSYANYIIHLVINLFFHMLCTSSFCSDEISNFLFEKVFKKEKCPKRAR